MTVEEDGSEGLIQFRIIEPSRYMKMKMDLDTSASELAEMEAMADENPQMKKPVDSLRSMIELMSGKTWMRVDMSKFKTKDMQISIENPDLVGVVPLIEGVATAERAASGAITGTLDATKVTDESIFGESAFEGLDAAKVKALPYEATLDTEGRLTKLVLDVPKFADTPAGKWAVDISGYGAAIAQEAPPAAEVKEMPADAYDMLNGNNG